MAGAELHFTDRDAWRAWLERHHDRERVVWLVFYKKHTGRPSVPYEHAVEEALCFGWIDSIVKRLDDDRYLRKFTPRTDSTRWSAINLERADRMVRGGRMTAAGSRHLAPGIQPETAPARRHLEIPLELQRALDRNCAARELFENLAPSYRRQFVTWIAIAKRAETRQRRTKEAVALLERGEKLGLR